MAEASNDTGKKEPTEYMKETPFIELPLQAYKARRNMLLCAILCGAQSFGVGFGGKGSFSVLTNELALTAQQFNTALILITLYFIIYFSVLGWATWLKWKLRSTGFPSSFANSPTAMMGMVPAYGTVEMSQTTLWQTLEINFEMTKKTIEAFLERNTESDQSNQKAINELSNLNSNFSNLADHSQKQLIAFENSFWEHQKTTYLTFFFVEYWGPLFAASVCAFILFVHVI